MYIIIQNTNDKDYFNKISGNRNHYRMKFVNGIHSIENTAVDA